MGHYYRFGEVASCCFFSEKKESNLFVSWAECFFHCFHRYSQTWGLLLLFNNLPVCFLFVLLFVLRDLEGSWGRGGVFTTLALFPFGFHSS
jgi:hypothetical protein